MRNSLLFLLSLQGTVFTGSSTVQAQQSVWTRRFPATSPTARAAHAMAYDLARQRTVLFGEGTATNAETWEWDGTNWLRRLLPIAPRARGGHAMAYDSTRGRVILFGGYGNAYLGDTWEWDGTTWSQRFPALSPPDRNAHAMTYDSGRARTVLFGGRNDINGFFADTWEWDGTIWTPRIVGPFPSARSACALAYDSARGRVVLFGGYGGSGSLGDTWEWDGTSWFQRTTTMAPPPRYSTALSYDTGLRRTVLFGGVSQFGDTWEWDGTTWFQRTTFACSPIGREFHAMAYDASALRTVLFGGYGGSTLLSDTWEFGPPDPIPPPCTDPCCIIGRGHCTGSLAIACATRPAIGGELHLVFTNPGNAAGFNLIYLGTRLDPPVNFGPPGLCDPGFVHPLPWIVLQALGNPATFMIQVPNDPVLVGQTVAVQGGSFEFSGCFRLTDGLAVTVQP